MALTKFTGATNTIQSLADKPNQDGGLSAAQLKAKFDQSAIDNEAYLNDTLTVELDALDAENVKKTGDQTIQGVKTFESSPIVPTPTTNMQASTKKYVDDKDSAQTSALNTHKTSNDHDGRYYTEAESDAKFETITDLTNTRKLSATGNFTGSWFGINNPTFADPGIANVVADHTSQLAEMTNIVGETSLQTAINNLPVGGTLTLKQGHTYIISTPLNLKSHIRINPNGATIKWADNTDPRSGQTGDANIGVINFIDAIGITIDGELIIDGNFKNNPWVTEHTFITTSTNGMDGIRGSCSNLYIKKLKVIDAQKMGININGYDENITIEYCEVDGSQRDGIFAVGKNVKINNNIVKNARDNSIAFDSQYLADPTLVGNVEISDNYIINTEQVSNQSGIYAGAKNGFLSKNVKIKGNSIIGVTYHGIDVSYIDGVETDNNTIKDLANQTSTVPHGTYVHNCSNVIIGILNKTYNCKGSGLIVKSNSNITINGEYFKNKRDGIQIDGGNVNLKIDSPKCYDNGRGINNVDENWAGIRFLDSSGVGATSDIEIINPSCFDTNTIVADKIQRYGIYAESNAIAVPFRIYRGRYDTNRNGTVYGAYPSGIQDYRSDKMGSAGGSFTTSYNANVTTVPFSNPYPSGITPNIQLTLTSASVGTWIMPITLNISNTGFTIAGQAGSATNVTFNWRATALI